jgi:hypothetical protein
MERLKKLLKAYEDAPEIYHATRYWRKAVDEITKEIEKADLRKLRSGEYPVFAKFGFYEYVLSKFLRYIFYTKYFQIY